MRYFYKGVSLRGNPPPKADAFGPPPYFASQNRDDKWRNTFTYSERVVMKDIKLILNIQLFAEGADGNEAQSAECKAQSDLQNELFICLQVPIRRYLNLYKKAEAFNFPFPTSLVKRGGPTRSIAECWWRVIVL